MDALENAFNSLFSGSEKSNGEKLAFVCEFDFSFFLNEFITNSFKKVNKEGSLYGFELRFAPYKGVNKLSLVTECKAVNPLMHFAKVSENDFDDIELFSVICSKNTKGELKLFLRKNESPRGLKTLSIREEVDVLSLFSKNQGNVGLGSIKK